MGFDAERCQRQELAAQFRIQVLGPALSATLHSLGAFAGTWGCLCPGCPKYSIPRRTARGSSAKSARDAGRTPKTELHYQQVACLGAWIIQCTSGVCNSSDEVKIKALGIGLLWPFGMSLLLWSPTLNIIYVQRPRSACQIWDEVTVT